MTLFNAHDFFVVGDTVRVTSHVYKYFNFGKVLSVDGDNIEIDLKNHPQYMPKIYNILSDEYSLDKVI